MSEKKMDVGALVNNGLGHPLARAITEGLWKTQLLRRFAAKSPDLMALISKGAMAVTSLLEVGGDHPVARFANYLAETIATENLELLKKFQENPDDPEVAKEFGEYVDVKVKQAEKAEVFLVFEHVHANLKCVAVAQLLASTSSTRTGKDGKAFTTPSPITPVSTDMSSALAAGKPLCGICYKAAPAGKPEEKAKEVVPGKNFMEHVMRLKSEEPDEFQKFWTTYLLRLEDPDGPELGRKFQEAFDGKHGYEAFRFVIGLPHRSEHDSEEWHHALDALLGKVEPAKKYKDIIKGFVDKELMETKKMFDAIFDWLEKGNRKRADRIAAKKAKGEKLDEEWAAQRAAMKTRKTVTKYVVAGLLVILASVYAINRTITGPASAEQKVESAHEHR